MRERTTITCNRALTLIELLAVIVILGMVNALGAMNLSAATEHTKAMALAAQLQELDERARLHARCGGRAVIIAVDGDFLSVVAVEHGTGTKLGEVAIPYGIAVAVGDDDGATVLDRRGVSADYAFKIRSNVRVLQLRVDGNTGHCVRQEVIR